MPAANYRILAINPGSTSTKFGLYEGNALVHDWSLSHSEQDLAPFAGKPIMEQEDYRFAILLEALREHGVDFDRIDATVGRGGLIRPMTSGTYEVNDVMLDEVRHRARLQHASNLGAVLAKRLADRAGVKAYIVDPVSVNERSPVARLSGSPLFESGRFCHALNSKAVAKRYAREEGKPYKNLRLITAHLGGGICIAAHADGLMFDATDAGDKSPYSPERAGDLPTLQLVEYCFSGKASEKQVKAMVSGEGGLYAYLGTRDLREVIERIEAGDKGAKLAFDGMAYQIGKAIGGMASALEGRLDTIILTGGMAYSDRLVDAVSRYVEWIASVTVYPGEEELTALSEGVVRVLNGEEDPKFLQPEGLQ
ncbi:butyrate kinase [uncultured Cohaesibacter sp.]|uniref:butyrate kinase n=1 Tax=uncultured Cohaesibacter sp. TaxID=1002546 RepID=UPI00293112C8|nr:butyrate kinase [uncultured Cohaesibacter sp.]